MEHKDFRVGQTFWTATGTWHCTDLGMRTVIAIKVTDPRDLHGPPYSVQEHVFDEHDVEGCYRSEAEMRADLDD